MRAAVPLFSVVLTACGGRITELDGWAEAKGGRPPVLLGGVSAFGGSRGATDSAGKTGSVTGDVRGGGALVSGGTGGGQGPIDASGAAGMLVAPQPWCGNGKVETQEGEQCDDGNRVPGDGCSAGCLIESAWCVPQSTCLRLVLCGDLVSSPGEECDDGNVSSGDGCSESCTIEPGWVCRVAGPCVSVPPLCGDGIRQAPESCDDGVNDGAYGGCNPDCTFAPYCGDEILTWPSEDCDDGNQVDFDGCSRQCRFVQPLPS
jgi:cysteine-rich repeat protein